MNIGNYSKDLSVVPGAVSDGRVGARSLLEGSMCWGFSVDSEDLGS